MYIFTQAKAVFAKAVAVGLLTAAGLQPAAASPPLIADAQQEVNGWNVVRATYDGGVFQRTSPGQWTEFNDGGATFTFEERNRYNLAVEMYDADRNVWLQIDIHRHMISAGTGNETRIDIYEVTELAAGAVTGNPLADSGITGLNVIRVDHDGGFFQNSNNRDWVEIANNGNSFQFLETGRSDWAVDLHDASRNVSLQIDIQRQMITIADENSRNSDLYPITSARQ